jgi:dolichol-phosphate mannosyltransferase
MPKYSIVIPSYKEANNLSVILPAIKAALSQESFELLVVDTNQKQDDTEEICLKNNCVYINRSPTDCYGDAVRTGIRNAKGQWLVFMDADGSHSPDFIPHLLVLTFKEDKCDVGIASRYIYGGSSENGKTLVWMSKILNAIYAKLLKIKCLDISTSFKIYKAEALKSIPLYCSHFDIIEEIIFKLAKKYPDLVIKEIPFAFKQRLYGKSKRSLLVFMYYYFSTLLKLCKQHYFPKKTQLKESSYEKF